MAEITQFDRRPINTRLGPYLVDTTAAASTLDEAIGVLTLAYEAVSGEAGTNETLTHAWCGMRLAIKSLDKLRDTLSEAVEAEAPRKRRTAV